MLSRTICRSSPSSSTMAAGEVRILVADQHGRPRHRPRRVLTAVDETEQVARVEVAEAVDLVLDRDDAGQPLHDLGGQLEAQVHPLGADVEEQVAGRGHGTVLGPGELTEGVQPGRSRAAEQAVPGL
jgi:hypothetical protein